MRWCLAFVLVLALLLLSAHTSTAWSLATSDDVVFSSGTIPTDLDGNPVSAHEGCMLTTEDSYLWYGSGAKQNVSDGTLWDWLSDSVLLYTSHDLSDWKRRATVFTAAAVRSDVRQRLAGSSNGPLRLERPKVLYNAAHRYYVLIVSLGSLDRSKAEVGWAVSVSPYGPFKFDGARQADGLPSYDLTVGSVDDTDAWLARTVPRTGIVISKLAGDYLDSSGRCATLPAPKSALQPQQSPAPHATSRRWQFWFGNAAHDGPVPTAAGASVAAAAAATGAAAEAVAVAADGLRSGLHLAARAMQLLFRQQQRQRQQWQVGTTKAVDAGALCLFMFGGKWYLLATQKMGWAPTKTILYVNNGTDPCDESSWHQLPAPAKGPGSGQTFDSTPAFVYAHEFSGSDKTLLVYFGDRWQPSVPQGPSNASYVWLPLVAAGDARQPDALQLLNLNSWRLGDFRPPAALEQS